MMSFLKNLFGASEPKKPTLTSNQGIEQLEEKADMLRKRIAHLQDQADEQQKIIRENPNNKPKAMAALKRKKAHEANIRTAEATLENLENQKDMLENASANAAILRTMADTAKIVKQEQNLDINKVEEIVDDLREQKEITEEVANVLSQTTHKTYDDDELLKELEDMQQEELDRKLLQTDKVLLPDVPTQLPAQPVASTSQKKDEEDELKKLQMWVSEAQ